MRPSVPARLRRLLWAGVVLSALLPLLGIGLALYELRQTRLETELRGQQLTDAVARQLHERLLRLEHALEMEAQLRPERPGEVRLRRPALPLHRIRIEAAERSVATPTDGSSPPGQGLQIAPLLRTTDGWRVPVALQDASGLTVRAQLDAEWFAELLQGYPLAEADRINILHQQGLMLARSHDNAGFIGKRLPPALLFAEPYLGQSRGRYREVGVLDGVDRLFTFQRIEGTPLIVVVGLARSGIVAAWLGFAVVVSIITLVLAALWIWLLRRYARDHARQQELLDELAMTQRRLSEACELAAVGDYEWDLDTGQVHWSAETCHIYGLEPVPTRLDIEQAFAMIHPEDVDRLRGMVEAELAGNGTNDAEFRIIRADGVVRWLYARGVLVQGDGRRVIRGVQQDITQTVETRQRLLQAQEIAAIGEWLWNVDAGTLAWSEQIYRIYGREPETFSPDPDSAFACIHPDDRDDVREYSRKLIENGEACRAEFRIVRPDGEIRVVDARCIREPDPSGRVIIRSIQQDITDVAATREQLQVAKENYLFLFERNPLPMWVVDLQTLRFLEVNEAAEEHYGYSRQQFLSMRLQDIRPPDEAAVLEKALRGADVQEQGRVWTHCLADGRQRRAAIYFRDIKFDGRRARLVLAQDVTEREAAEQRFRLIARATSDAVYDLDIDNDLLWWGDSFYSTFGYQPAQMAPTLAAWEALVHPEDLAQVSASLTAAIQDRRVDEWEEEYRFRRQDGEYAVVVDRGFFVRNNTGLATRMLGGMLDVTETRRREADLRLLSRAVEAVDSGVVIADARDPELPLVYVNRAFEEMTGYAAAECLGRNCRFLQAGDRDQAELQHIRNALREQREVRVVLRNYSKNGTLFWNELHLAPVHAEDGSVTHFVGIQRDVSHRQKHEQELAHRATHDQLTGLPNRQLLHDRLQQAIRNAERYGRKATVLFLDLDDFKLVNDSLDHAAGDQALCMVAERLCAQVRETDTVGRFGGDEFVVVLTEQDDEDGVGQVIARISAALSQPMEIGGTQHVLTPSIGWCRYPEAGQDPETLLKHADMAMYQAKRGGRNRAERYDPALDALVSHRLQLVG
ncbi:MAG: PAS domain-containing protein, partial [Luteimonas sp.]